MTLKEQVTQVIEDLTERELQRVVEYLIPFTTNLKRAALPSCVRVSAGEGGLLQDSVLLCHQVRVLDRIRLR
jgi:mRNA-degrading endonuclease toxin of MazEF toxin-antitoxin module